MSANVERLDGLKCRIEIAIPAKEVEQAVEKRLKEMAPKVNLKGFRPGHIPMAELQRRFGNDVRNEAMNEQAFKVLQDTLEKEDIRPAGYPSIEPMLSEDPTQVRCQATFEVFPEVRLVGLSGQTFERVQAEVTDKDLDDTLEQLRKQHIDWLPTERAAQDGDQLIIDFKGMMDGKELDRGSAKGYSIVLGESSMIPGFEDGLVGAKTGAELKLDLNFPDEYFEKEIAGKPVHFEVTVQKVSEPKLPALDDSFAENLKVTGGVAALKDDVRKNLEKEVKFRSKTYIKNALIDKLLELNEFDVPSSLIDQEIKSMMEDMKKRTGQEYPENFEVTQFEDMARSRVRTGLIFSQAIKEHKLAPTEEDIDKHLQGMAASFDNPEQVIGVYKSNERLLDNVKAEVLEEMVVEKLLSEATLNERSMSFEEFKNYSESKEQQSS